MGLCCELDRIELLELFVRALVLYAPSLWRSPPDCLCLALFVNVACYHPGDVFPVQLVRLRQTLSRLRHVAHSSRYQFCNERPRIVHSFNLYFQHRYKSPQLQYPRPSSVHNTAQLSLSTHSHSYTQRHPA